MTDMSETAARLNTHEAVCAERYRNVEVTLRELKGGLAGVKATMWAVAGGVVLNLLSVIGFLVSRIN